MVVNRIDFKIDPELRILLDTNQLEGESTTACFKRLARIGGNHLMMLSDFSRSFDKKNSEMIEIIRNALSEQQSTQDRFLSQISEKLEYRNLENLPEKVERKVQDFADSVRQPFQQISDHLNEIHERICNLVEE